MEEALEVGQNWWRFTNPQHPELNLRSVQAVERNSLPLYYIIAAQDSGFILVAADDACHPILGYSSRGTFEYPITSPEAADWMSQYEAMIADVQSRKLSNRETLPIWNDLRTGSYERWLPTRTREPLLTTTWDQGDPYNALCPVDASSPAGGHAWAGCGAAGMAQVMRYWSYPVQGTGSLSYDSSYGTVSANFGATTYNWDNMPATCQPGNLDIALLTYHCAISLHTSFSPVVSTFSTYNLPMAFYNYFNYSNPTLTYRGSIDYNTWVNRITGNLDAGRPVLYIAAHSSVSHVFILDGYESTDFFHVNWCWGGNYDGYYYLDNLNPGGVLYAYTHAGLFDLYPLQSVPLRPSNLTATFSSNYLVNLHWQDIADNEDGFQIERRTGVSGTWSPIATLGANSTSYTDTDLVSFSTYYYRVKAYNSQGSSSWSNEAITMTSGIISPVELEISGAGNDLACLSWNSSPNAALYRVYAAETPLPTDSPDWQLLGETSSLFWDITASEPYKFYYVTALSAFEVPQNFVQVPGGTFYNGVSNVTLSTFYIDKYEVTQESYLYVMGVNPSNFLGDTSFPVEKVSWFKAIEYCNRRSIQEGLLPCYSYGTSGTDPDAWPAGWNTDNANHSNVSCNWTASGYRLPTEMEWMFAAKGGNASLGYTYSGSNDLDAVAWYYTNAGLSTHAVATKAANELGLFDMSGNVFEWVWDIYATPYPAGNQTNPHGASSGTQRVRRGGAYSATSGSCTVAYRYPGNPTTVNANLGFRVCRVAP